MTEPTVAAAAAPRARSGSWLRAVDVRVSTIAFWVLLAAGMAMRIVLLATTSFRLDSDNAVVFLVTKHMLHGDIVWFFWGQTYGGTLLEMVAAVGMLVFGTHVEVLAIVGTLFFAGATILIRQIAIEAFDQRVVGDVAGVLSWFSGYWIARVGTSEPGFYGPSLVLGLLTIWLVLRRSPQKSYLQWALIGLCAGLALWQSPMGIALAAPAVLVALIRHRSPLGGAIAAMAGILGSLPWLITLGGNSSGIRPQTSSGLVVESFGTFFSRVLPAAFSVSNETSRYAVAAIALLLLALLVVLAVVERSWWLGTLMASTGAVVVVIVVGTGILLTGDALRYSVFVMPALAIALAWLLTREPFVGLVGMVLAVTLTLGQTHQLFPELRFSGDETYVLGDITGLGRYLEANGITHAYGDYWLSYSVTAATDENVTVAPISGNRRYEPYEASAAEQDPVTLIVYLDDDNDRTLMQGTGFPPSTRTVAGGFAIYTFDQPFDPYDYAWALY